MKHFHCPVNGWDCPHYKNEEGHECLCTLANPVEECDDFYMMWGDCSPAEYTDKH